MASDDYQLTLELGVCVCVCGGGGGGGGRGPTINSEVRVIDGKLPPTRCNACNSPQGEPISNLATQSLRNTVMYAFLVV